ncbi:MAG: hypothetical protein ACR2O0_11535, partial [Rhizobiaceae bacterium]
MASSKKLGRFICPPFVFELTGCATVGPDFEVPDTPALGNWSGDTGLGGETEKKGGLTQRGRISTKWWQVFKDKNLN